MEEEVVNDVEEFRLKKEGKTERVLVAGEEEVVLGNSSVTSKRIEKSPTFDTALESAVEVSSFAGPSSFDGEEEDDHHLLLFPRRSSTATSTSSLLDPAEELVDSVLDDDLIAALATLQDHSSGTTLENFLPSPSFPRQTIGPESYDLSLPDTLEDIDVSPSGEEDFLDDFDGSIFDDDDNNKNSNSSFDTETYQDDETSDLLSRLAELTLGADHPTTPDDQEGTEPIQFSVAPGVTEDVIQDADDGLPPYLYCQPCTPSIPQEQPLQQQELIEEGAIYPYCLPCTPETNAPAAPSTATVEDDLTTSFRNLGLASISEQAPLQDGAVVEGSGPIFSEHPDIASLKLMDDIPVHPEPASQLDQQFQHYVVSRRPEAVQAALSYTCSFGTGIYQPEQVNVTPPNERTCLGHKETVYGLTFSPDGEYMATASQDGTVRIWKTSTHALEHTLEGHSKENEVLRVAWASSSWASHDLKRGQQHQQLIASGSADGVVKVWSFSSSDKKSKWMCVATLDHSSLELRPKPTTSDGSEPDPPQIYGLQFIDDWKGLGGVRVGDSTDNAIPNSFLLTSSEDFVHLWEIENVQNGKIFFIEVLSIRFTSLYDVGYGVSLFPVTSNGMEIPNNKENSVAAAQTIDLSNPVDPATVLNPQQQQNQPFGGERNPDNIIFVFDVSYCPANELLGVALSDGSLRLVNGRGVAVAALTLPGCQSHLTSLAWDSTGNRLASCVATGHVILWDMRLDAIDENEWRPSCRAVLEGGHALGRPLYGAHYCGEDNLILSWGADGKLCLWDSHSQGNIHAPISVLLSKPTYPLFAVDVASYSKKSDKSGDGDLIMVGVGGGREGGFLGLPTYLYDVKPLMSAAAAK